jgi:prevent-host-death family protein
MADTVVINVHEAKTHFSKLLDRVHAGEELVLVKAGVPYAHLVPLQSPRSRPQFGRLAATRLITFYELGKCMGNLDPAH